MTAVQQVQEALEDKGYSAMNAIMLMRMWDLYDNWLIILDPRWSIEVQQASRRRLAVRREEIAKQKLIEINYMPHVWDSYLNW